jgi:hypothetical protein
VSYRVAPSPLGIIASGTTGCETGLVVSANGSCCADKNWWNQTYLVVKGQLSYRYHNEKRVRYALWLLSAEQLDDYVWKLKSKYPALEVPAKLRAGIDRATRNFHAYYPLGRWYKVEGAIEHDCGPFSVWKANPVDSSSAAYVAAQRDVAVGLSGADKTPGSVALSDPALGLIITVPGAALMTRRVGSMPAIEDLLTVQPVGNGAELRLAPWTKALLDRMAPLWAGVALPLDRRMFLARTEPAKVEIPKDVIKRAAMDDGDKTGGFPWLLAGGAVVLVGGGAAYWYFRGR